MHSIRIARDEMRRLTASPLAAVAIVVVMMVPLLYGALYLWAFWDPYGRLADLPVALVNLDRPARSGDETVTAGADLADELLDRGTFQWHVVSPAQAKAGLRDGDYYMALTIPADFSADLATADSKRPRQARLDAIERQGSNYIASQIGERVFAEVRTAAAESATRGYVDRMLIGFTDAHGSVREAALGAKDLATGLADARAGAVKLADGAATARGGSADLASGAGELASGMKTLHSGTTQLAAGASALSAGISTADDGATRLAAGASAADTGARTLSDGLASAAAGAQGLAGGADNANTGAQALESGTAQLAGGADALATSAHDLATGASDVNKGLGAASGQLASAAKGSVAVRDGSDQVVQLLEAYEAAHGLSGDAEFQRVLATARGTSAGAGTLAEGLGSASGQLPALLEGSNAIAEGAARLAGGADRLSAGAAGAAKGASDLAGGTYALLQGAAALSTGVSDASDGSKVLADGTQQLAAGSSDLAAGLGNASTGSRTLAGKLAQARSGAAKLDAGASALATGTNQLHAGLATLSDGSAKLARGLRPAVSGSRELAYGLTAGTGDLPSYSKASRDAHADMMSNPVELSETQMDPVPNYGTGFAPYFIPLALWVGSLIAYLLIKPLPKTCGRAKVPGWRRALGGYWPGMLVGGAQAVLLLAVVQLGLGLTAQHTVALYAFAVLTAFAFAAIIQMLAATLGPGGKLAGIVILMLQLTSSAGTYPIETTAPFFQAIHPLLPMTYVVSGLRTTISGGPAVTLLADAVVVAAWGLGSLLVTAIVAQRGGSKIAQRLDAAIEM